MSRFEAKARDERGVTLTELLLVVIITGLIIAAITAVLVQGMSLGPKSQARSAFAVDASLLGNRMSDDIANATVMDDFDILGNTKNCELNNVTYGFAGLGKFTLAAGDVVYYAILYPSAVAGSNDLQVVVSTSGPDVSGNLLVGYCNPGTELVLDDRYPDPTYSLTLKLAPTREGESKTIRLGGTRRDLPAPAG